MKMMKMSLIKEKKLEKIFNKNTGDSINVKQRQHS